MNLYKNNPAVAGLFLYNDEFLSFSRSITISTINFLIWFWLKWKLGYFCPTINTFPISLKHPSLEIASTALHLTSSLTMTIATIDWQIIRWFKWKFSYLCSTSTALPITRKHLSCKIAVLLFEYHETKIS